MCALLALSVAAGVASSEPSAPVSLGWTIVGFTADGAHVVFEREHALSGCLQISLEVFRADDNHHVVSVPLGSGASKAPGCVDRRDAESFTRAIGRVSEVFGAVEVPRRLRLEAGEWRGESVRVSVEVQPQLPATGCERITEAMRARAYLRFRVTRDERTETLGRLVEIAPVADPLVDGCLEWPRLELRSAALRADGAKLAAVAADLPLVLTLP